LEKRPFLKRPFFPRKLPLKKGPFLKRPFFLNERGNFSVLFLQRQKKSTLEKRVVSETPLFPRKLPLEKGPFLKRPFFPTTIQWTIYRQYSTYTNLSLGPVSVLPKVPLLHEVALRQEALAVADPASPRAAAARKRESTLPHQPPEEPTDLPDNWNLSSEPL
jgi:hypothetical protein